MIDDITDVDYHVGEQSAYILDKELDSIVAFDMNTSQVESLLKGNGDDFSTVDHSGIEAIKVEFDALNNRVIVLTEDALYSIDSLGNRVELSGSSVGVGEEINSFDAMAFDEPHKESGLVKTTVLLRLTSPAVIEPLLRLIP